MLQVVVVPFPPFACYLFLFLSFFRNIMVLSGGLLPGEENDWQLNEFKLASVRIWRHRTLGVGGLY